MKIENIDVDSAIDSVKALLSKEKDLSPALRSALEVLLVLVTLLLNRITHTAETVANRHRQTPTDA